MTSSTVTRDVEIAVPVSTAYERFARFESFPRFMEGVESVHRVDGGSRLLWHATFNGRERDWEAEIVTETPDRELAWRSVTGRAHNGRVTFRPLDAGHCVVMLDLEQESDGLRDSVGQKLGSTGHRIQNDLERFRIYVEERDLEAGEITSSGVDLR